MRGRCPEHARAERQRDAKTKAYGYRSGHWQRIRRERLELAGFLCELRLGGCTEVATHVHLDPAYRGMHHAALVEHTRACLCELLRRNRRSEVYLSPGR